MKYLVFDKYDHRSEFFDTLKEAISYAESIMIDEYDEYIDSCESIRICEVKLKPKLEVVDEKSNYKYESEEEIPEDIEDWDDNDVWPYSNSWDTICGVEWIEVENES